MAPEIQLNLRGRIVETAEKVGLPCDCEDAVSALKALEDRGVSYIYILFLFLASKKTSLSKKNLARKSKKIGSAIAARNTTARQSLSLRDAGGLLIVLNLVCNFSNFYQF